MTAKKKIGFKEARRRLCQALQNPTSIVHEQRGDQEEKNLLATGVVTPREVLNVVRAATGNDYEEDVHHQDASVVIHVISRTHQGLEWYIKWYFVEPNVIFISVHH
jgi:hypothetical protein